MFAYGLSLSAFSLNDMPIFQEFSEESSDEASESSQGDFTGSPEVFNEDLSPPIGGSHFSMYPTRLDNPTDDQLLAMTIHNPPSVEEIIEEMTHPTGALEGWTAVVHGAWTFLKTTKENQPGFDLMSYPEDEVIIEKLIAILK